MIDLLPRARRWGRWMSTVFAVDITLIVVQTVVRGRRMHFNLAGETERTLRNLMATGAYVAFLAPAVVAAVLSFQRLRDKVPGERGPRRAGARTRRDGRRDADVHAAAGAARRPPFPDHGCAHGRRPGRWSRPAAARLEHPGVRAGAVGYLALILVLTWQALRGQSVVHPDGWSLLAFAGIAVFILGGVTVAVRRVAQQPSPVPA
ncbi:hypothetical protein LWP59_37190 [Amycolatopsis acidiphila]|uniref:Uncharacterized protein n=1 Tax=Amycolatopsis acidiphila TaxID=715473 RepID=A0A558AEJ7_9PSEU|nr:hypothetical protein [Amycolatopsis acidiphila]TVT22643.1 hypothetical protein FNH06_12435 [Amycolatopsis acidiphila]UIJ59597.1 hypothetical protein LWP59_37190 [Amycolatopsis acidiphila]GHG80824.1 hypothetical protein GCM10017788_50160 [Amycolatopsis acidiphila]